MSRDVDERKKRAALRKLRKAAALAEQGLGPELSDWERQFLEEVEERSAFADQEKGGEGEALSSLQRIKLKEIDKKARGKGKSGFKSKTRPAYTPRVRDIAAEEEEPPADASGSPPSRPAAPRLVTAPTPPPPPQDTPATPTPRPRFRVIEGGKQAADD